MTTPLLPTAAEKAAAQLDAITGPFVRLMQNNLARYEMVLNKTVGDDGKTLLTADQIIAVAPERYAKLQPFMAAVQTAVTAATT